MISNHGEKTRTRKEGNIYGFLTVISFHGTSKLGTSYLCRCVCGEERVVLNRNLGNTKRNQSCGCNGQGKNLDTLVTYIFCDYKNRAKKKGQTFNLDKKLFTLKINEPCHYCNRIGINTKKHSKRTYPYNGLDRKDNSKGYTEENVLTCCKDCNTAKGTMTYLEFIKHIQRMYKHTQNTLEVHDV